MNKSNAKNKAVQRMAKTVEACMIFENFENKCAYKINAFFKNSRILFQRCPIY